MDLVLATTNMHKIRELRSLLKLLARYDVYSLFDFPNYTPPQERGCTFEENAIIKAKTAALALKKWVIADDSGLVVPSLGGEPGVFSARYAGPDQSDKENRAKLLDKMKQLSGLERVAYFECAMACSSPKGEVTCVHGRVEGIIVEKERGKSGFGYDSLFQKHDYLKTFGEIDEELKNKVSHRAKALQKILIFLESL